MPRNMKHGESIRAAKERRRFALSRPEIGLPSAPRVPAASPTAMAVKVNPERDLIEAFLAKKGGTK